MHRLGLMRAAAGVLLFCALSARAELPWPERAETGPADHFDVSAPLWLMPPSVSRPHPMYEPRRIPRPPGTGEPDPVVQSSHVPVRAMPTASVSFAGVGDDFAGPQGLFAPDSAPPDTNGAIGPTRYLQLVNSAFAVFKRDGTPVYGPVATSTLWHAFGGLCETDNDGDGVVLYDRAADRWVVTQLAVTGATSTYYECVAISTSGDPTGSWNRYAFAYSALNDYPKIGIWPDGYYATFNLFSGNTFLNGKVCAYDRTRMLAGLSATQQCFNAGYSMLPSDLDGALSPPANSPNFVLALGTNALELWKFHVDWATPANTTLSQPVTIPVAPFADACSVCIFQFDSSEPLASLGDRLMFRLAYRRFADHESLVVNHSVSANGTVGIRWYELRAPNGAVTVTRQGTYAPDTNFRWMGSAALDQVGNMAVGFSASGTNVRPSIRFAGRLASDPAGQLGQGETTLDTGAGSQEASLYRWGDYSSLTIDPLDDCTFWFTSEEIPTNGTYNWTTRIGAFRFPGCPPDDFSLSVTPATQTVAQLGAATYVVQSAVVRGAPGSVTLSTVGLPLGVTASFNPPSLTPDGGSVMTLSASADAGFIADAGFEVRGTSAEVTRFASAAFTVPPNDFGLSVSDVSVAEGQSTATTVATQVTSGRPELVSLSISGLPPGVTAVFAPPALDAGTPAQLIFTALDSAPVVAGTVATVHGTAVSGSHSVSLHVTVPPNDFAVSVSPTSLGVPIGGSTATVVSTSVLSGASRPVTLSLSGLPTGLSASFSASAVDPGSPSTLTLSAAAGAPSTDAGLIITGTSATASHSVTLPVLVLQPPTVAVTSPEAGAQLSGIAAIEAAATVSPLTAVSKIELYVDGARLDPVATASPAQVAWNTASTTNSSHVLTARVYDAAGESADSAPVTVSVDNVVAKGCHCSADPTGGLFFAGVVALLRLTRRRSGRRRE